MSCSPPSRLPLDKLACCVQICEKLKVNSLRSRAGLAYRQHIYAHVSPWTVITLLNWSLLELKGIHPMPTQRYRHTRLTSHLVAILGTWIILSNNVFPLKKENISRHASSYFLWIQPHHHHHHRQLNDDRVRRQLDAPPVTLSKGFKCQLLNQSVA